MDCTEARTFLLDRRRGALDEDLRGAVDDHLEGCEACRLEDAADAELSAVLEERLPRPRPPPALKRSLEARWLGSGEGERTSRSESRRRVARWAWGVASMAAGAMLAVGAMSWRGTRSTSVLDGGANAEHERQAMLAEAVNDHLRVLYSEHPVEVEGPDTHKVKPWFLGRVDFAPMTAFAGDEDFPLEGGSVAYFVDRKAASLVFKRRLHVITLLIFPAHDLPWSSAHLRQVGRARGTLETSRGFHVLSWREDDLGYALVSDLDENELTGLGARIAGP